MAAPKKPAKKAAPKKAAARKTPGREEEAGARSRSKSRPKQRRRANRLDGKPAKSARHRPRRPSGPQTARRQRRAAKPNQAFTIIQQPCEAKGSGGSIRSPARKRKNLLQLRDAMVDSMAGVAQDTLRARAEGSEASAFGMHQADAGSDAYDRDFALSLLSQEQDALYEIDEALKRIDLGTYGKCEMSGKPILRARLEAIPFARFTVECQSQLEKQNKASRVRQSVTSLFGLTDEEARDGDEEEPVAETKE